MKLVLYPESQTHWNYIGILTSFKPVTKISIANKVHKTIENGKSNPNEATKQPV